MPLATANELYYTLNKAIKNNATNGCETEQYVTETIKQILHHSDTKKLAAWELGQAHEHAERWEWDGVLYHLESATDFLEWGK